jgi:hypothetical protein
MTEAMNYVLIGDIHSQFTNLEQAINFVNSSIENPYVIFLGDAFDSRCEESDSAGVYHILKKLQDDNRATILHSNHQWKLQRFFYGNNVKIDEALQKTLDDFSYSSITKDELLFWLESLPYACSFRDNFGQEYRCAHAYHSSKLLVPRQYDDLYCVHTVSRYMRDKLIYGSLYENKRVLWWEKESNHDWIRCSGHYHTVAISYPKRALVLDSNCGDKNGLLSVYNVNTRELFQF